MCFNEYDLTVHIPSVLPPCGHSFCQACIPAIRPQCPTCRVPFEQTVVNYDLRSHIEEKQSVLDAIGRPLCALVVGAAGMGKSSLINQVAKRTVARTSSSASSVTQFPSIVFDENIKYAGQSYRLKLLDTPGIFDLRLSSEAILVNVVELIRSSLHSGAFDMIVLVILSEV